MASGDHWGPTTFIQLYEIIFILWCNMILQTECFHNYNLMYIIMYNIVLYSSLNEKVYVLSVLATTLNNKNTNNKNSNYFSFLSFLGAKQESCFVFLPFLIHVFLLLARMSMVAHRTVQ